MILPSLLCLGRIYRILRILCGNPFFCMDTVGMLPDEMIRLTCAQTAAWLARRYIQERLRRALLCAAELLRLHLCISVSAVRVADGAASPGLHIGKCSLDALLIGSDASSVSPSNPAGAEREARCAHVVGGERRDTHREEEKERRLSCLSSPLASLLSPPSKRNRFPFPITTPFAHSLSASGMAPDHTPSAVACITVKLLRHYLLKYHFKTKKKSKILV